MSPAELQRLQLIQGSVRLLEAARTAARMAIDDLDQVGQIESEDLKRTVAELLGQLQELSSQGVKFRGT